MARPSSGHKDFILLAALTQQLEQLIASGQITTLKGILHGIEKEGLRVTPNGHLAQTDHPTGLGAALTNSQITTDYSEALLEFITPVYERPEDALAFLAQLHQFAYQHLGDELIWAGSMPCYIDSSASIPIARYGHSHNGTLKHVYRVGLEHRYGKMMQTIAGIHYNFSLPDSFWQALQAQQGNQDSLQTFRSDGYFRLIRNFRRHSWLLLYLFGASPALSDSFMEGRPHQLAQLNRHTLYLPYATSLRMSDLGYSNKAQASLNICFNHLDSYTHSLEQAIHSVHPPYEKIGVKVGGQYRQLNTHILQIENEYYSDIRPKRVTEPGEKPLHALQQRGVEYIEVRNTDINPLLPLGMDAEQACFLDTFLLSCLLLQADEISTAECGDINENLARVVRRGREPGLQLLSPQGEQPLQQLGERLLALLIPTAEALDTLHQTQRYSASVQQQQRKLTDPDLTPSAQVLSQLNASGLEYTDWLTHQSAHHRDYFSTTTLAEPVQAQLTQAASDSLHAQQQLEAASQGTFDDFLATYLSH